MRLRMREGRILTGTNRSTFKWYVTRLLGCSYEELYAKNKFVVLSSWSIRVWLNTSIKHAKYFRFTKLVVPITAKST